MISDNYRLLGLVINTIPFTYADQTVTANYSAVVVMDEIVALKADIEQQINSLPESATDEDRRLLSDDLMFVNTMIENLNRAA